MNTIMVITEKWPMEPAHTSLAVMEPVMISMPRKRSEVQWVFTVSHRYRVATVTARTRTPMSVRPLVVGTPKLITRPNTSAIM